MNMQELSSTIITVKNLIKLCLMVKVQHHWHHAILTNQAASYPNRWKGSRWFWRLTKAFFLCLWFSSFAPYNRNQYNSSSEKLCAEPLWLSYGWINCLFITSQNNLQLIAALIPYDGRDIRKMWYTLGYYQPSITSNGHEHYHITKGNLILRKLRKKNSV